MKSIPVSKKATPGHLAVIQARDKTYEVGLFIAYDSMMCLGHRFGHKLYCDSLVGFLFGTCLH